MRKPDLVETTSTSNIGVAYCSVLYCKLCCVVLSYCICIVLYCMDCFVFVLYSGIFWRIVLDCVAIVRIYIIECHAMAIYLLMHACTHVCISVLFLQYTVHHSTSKHFPATQEDPKHQQHDAAWYGICRPAADLYSGGSKRGAICSAVSTPPFRRAAAATAASCFSSRPSNGYMSDPRNPGSH